MSVPRHLRLDDTVSRTILSTGDGTRIAALVATPPHGSPIGAPGLLVPGYTGSKEDFLHLLPLLAAEGRAVTAIDLPGQYESDGAEDPAAYTLEALGAQVASLLDHPTHVVGHSFGGLVCRDAALRQPAVRSLTLLASGPAALSGHRATLVELMRPLLHDGGVRAVWEAAAAAEPPDTQDGVPPEVRDFLKQRFLASPAAALLGMGQALTDAPDRVAELRDSGIPTFVLYGTSDDAWPPAEQAAMADRLGARHVALEGASHSPAVDATEATAAALLDFWAAVDGR